MAGHRAGAPHYAAHGGSHYAAHLGHGHEGHYASHGPAQGHGALAEHNQIHANRPAQGQAHNQAVHSQFMHNQFVAQHFHGLNNFNKTGFNRNAFGSNTDWNHWGGQFWGAGWDNWGGGWGGWAGPVFWPFVLGDVVSFVFWPYDYDAFWGYGPDFILAGIFAPGPFFGLEYGYGLDYYGYGPEYGYAGIPNIYYYNAHRYRSKYRRKQQRLATTTDREALAETNNEAVRSCSSLAPGTTKLPAERIRQRIHPTSDQQTALDGLSAAIGRAQGTVATSCPNTVPLTPIGRLDAAEQRLDVTITAIQIVRPALVKFYDSLTDEQKAELNKMGAGERISSVGGDLATLCSQEAEGAVSVPIQRIEQVVGPNAQQQQSAFDDLNKTSQKAADQLRSSCPGIIPQSPVARLDTVETRLNSMLAAIKSIRPSLERFYASLSDEQKARFNTMGPPPQTASSRP